MKHIKTYKIFEGKNDLIIGNKYVINEDDADSWCYFYIGYEFGSSSPNKIYNFLAIEINPSADKRSEVYNIWVNQTTDKYVFTDTKTDIESFLKKNINIIEELMEFISRLLKYDNESGKQLNSLKNRIESDEVLKKYINLNQLGMI